MASNTFANGSADGTVTFDRPIDHLNINVSTGTTFSFSIDKGLNFMTLPAGFHSIPLGSVSEVRIQSDGEWQLIGVQA